MKPATQKTTILTKPDPKAKWYHIDANNQVLGRMSVTVTNLLRGKNKPLYTPHVDCGDFVVVTNIDKVRLTGKKWDDKKYWRHSHHVGGIKSQTAKEIKSKHPERLLFSAVKGMLQRNKMARKQLTKLKVYAGDKHPHEAQNPETITLK